MIKGTDIKKYRLKNSLSQEEFADMIGVKLNTVCRWETDKYSPSIKYQKVLNNLIGPKKRDIKDDTLIKSPLNYTGNKYRILPQIVPHFPKKIGVFVDLFCGGATVGINVNADKVYFIDSNERVISLLRYLSRINFPKFVKQLEEKIEKYNLSYSNLNGYAHYFDIATPENRNNGLKAFNKEGFLKLRKDYNAIIDKNSDDANLLLYLLLVYGFNNDLRFNSKGEYNLPCGKTDLNKFNLNKIYEFNLRAQEREYIFICGDFRDPKIREICFNADYLYLDPPYLLSDAVYNENSGWNESKECELINFLGECLKHHTPFCLSNVLSKENGETYNLPLKKFIEENKDLKLIDIEYHYRSSSYNKKNRDSNEREIILLSGEVVKNEN